MDKTELYGANDFRSYLSHHGILGQKWGVRRYQAYGDGGYDRKGGKTGKNIGEAKTRRSERQSTSHSSENSSEFLSLFENGKMTKRAKARYEISENGWMSKEGEKRFNKDVKDDWNKHEEQWSKLGKEEAHKAKVDYVRKRAPATVELRNLSAKQKTFEDRYKEHKAITKMYKKDGVNVSVTVNSKGRMELVAEGAKPSQGYIVVNTFDDAKSYVKASDFK